MSIRLPLIFMMITLIFSGCEEEREVPQLDFELDFQPLAIGNTWIYSVDETIYFGENDSETSAYFYRDSIRSSFLNAEREVVYIVDRSRSTNRVTWSKELDYTLILRDNSIVRTVANESLVSLVFPPKQGLTWNGRRYQAQGDDDFEIDLVGASAAIPGLGGSSTIRVNQEKFDDKITLRDIRYEVFGKGIGLVEKYDEVITYCSRNNCLGQQLINGGRKTHLKLVGYDTK
jgi:hypothetical protein